MNLERPDLPYTRHTTPRDDALTTTQLAAATFAIGFAVLGGWGSRRRGFRGGSAVALVAMSVFAASILGCSSGSDDSTAPVELPPEPPTGGQNAGVRTPEIPTDAVVIQPADRASEVVNAHPAGTVFVFASGLHRGVDIEPRAGDSYLGEAGALLSGAEVLSGFEARDGFWAVDGQTSELAGHGGCGTLEDDTPYESCSRPEQLFVDGEIWYQVDTLAELGTGTWFFDYALDRVYVGADPAGHEVELSTTAQAFHGTAPDVRIAGLMVERYAARAQSGAIDGSDSTGWLVESNELRFNHGYGLRVGHGMQVLDNYVHHNGQLGMGGVGDDVLVAGNEIAHNHTANYSEAWEAGGTKFAVSENLVLRDNWVHHNAGRGVWTDIDNVNVLIANNLVEWNERGGIVHEIGYEAVIRDNVARYNGLGFGLWAWGAQILVQNSSDTQVTGNHVMVSEQGGNGITIVHQDRGDGPRGPYRAERVTVMDNVIRHQGNTGVNGAPDGCELGNRFDSNIYEALADWFTSNGFMWCGDITWEQFQAAGHEANGTAVVR